MVEFGAKLSLKDNMSATLKKNLKIQQEFSKQIKATANNMKALAKQKLAPVIKVKDTATKVIKKVKDGLTAVGKTIAKPFVALKDGATKGLSKIKSMLGSLAKGATIAVGIAGAGLTALVGGSIGEGAKLQQSIGGVETLFGADAGVVMANADKAYKTAGLSANAYMETVTSFSASLLQSLGGDTAKSGKIADMALIDMADNANKFGTDMSSIQNAYQGFAKQNYTMLDNLKLGYGGTKEEMQRLLKDAQKITGVKYDISNLSDVYNAIHAIQDNMGITGATKDEAEKTFTGSFNAMKASAQNLLGNLTLGGDITGSMEQLVDSAITFLVGNFIPMVGNIFTALPKAISTGIKKVAPQLKTVGKDLLTNLQAGILGFLPSSMQGVASNMFSSLGKIFSSVTGMLSSVAPKIAEKFSGIFGNGSGIIDGITNTIQQAMPIIESLLLGVSDVVVAVLPVIMSAFKSLGGVIQTIAPVVQSLLGIIGNAIKGLSPVINTIFQGIGSKISSIVEVIGSKMGFFKEVFETAVPIISSILETAWNVISPIIDIAISVFDVVLSVVEKVFPTIRDIIQDVWDFLKPIFDGIGTGLGWIADGVSKFAGWISGDKKKKGSSNAYGKDRVPYDNYPAVLHQGEKVLTRNQADQYDRQMSTRGIKVTPISSVSQNTAGGGGNSIHIDKLADTVVIEKEADVDKVVEDMVNKFKKLIPNMT